MPITWVIRIERKHAKMGMSASQARLLSITARLTSNEYESQQITNAKMRLATQSQEASEAYISALNTSQYNFVTYNSAGESVNTPLTAAVLYEYGDNKNQYIITNSAGKALVSNNDYKNYQKSANLDEFLACYGITKSFKTKTLEDTYNKSMSTDVSKGGLRGYKDAWENFVEDNYGGNNYTYTHYDFNPVTGEPENVVNLTGTEAWQQEKQDNYEAYVDAQETYSTLVQNKELGAEIQDLDVNGNPKKDQNGDDIYRDITNEDVQKAQDYLDSCKKAYTDVITFTGAKESRAIADCNDKDFENNTYQYNDITYKYSDLYTNYQKYLEAKSEYTDELDRLGITADGAYQYSDKTKAQWYTNLWYKMNGESTDKSGLNNCAVLNPATPDETSTANSDLSAVRNLATMESSSWITEALAKGYITLEKAEYTGGNKVLQNSEDPFKFNLKGISWNPQIYSSCSDIVSSDNDKAASKAEAEYERKTAEINAKDEKYQRKLSLLDTEHNAIQQEYESVKSAMEKNIDRSFKAFQG